MMGLAPHTGRNEAHDLVYDACRVAIESDRPLLDVLLETPAVAGPLGADKTARADRSRELSRRRSRRWSTTSSPIAENQSTSALACGLTIARQTAYTATSALLTSAEA